MGWGWWPGIYPKLEGGFGHMRAMLPIWGHEAKIGPKTNSLMKGDLFRWADHFEGVERQNRMKNGRVMPIESCYEIWTFYGFLEDKMIYSDSIDFLMGLPLNINVNEG